MLLDKLLCKVDSDRRKEKIKNKKRIFIFIIKGKKEENAQFKCFLIGTVDLWDLAWVLIPN